MIRKKIEEKAAGEDTSQKDLSEKWNDATKGLVLKNFKEDTLYYNELFENGSFQDQH